LEQPVWFVPGRPEPLEGLLARYRPLQPAGAAAEYVERLTGPGDLVLDLFCQGATFVREAVRAGRRALGVNVNPISLLVAGLGLEQPPDVAALSAAFTRLADSPKGDVPLRLHLASLYRARCPGCGGEGTAEWFAWDREARYPYAKRVRCSRCEEVRDGPTDEEDIAAARRFEPRGLAYHYALNRAAPVDHPARERAAELVELYTPRNLSALMDVALRLEGLDVERPLQLVLEGLLLTAFDRGSSLDPHGEARARPRVLRPPIRFLERNVWLLLEDGLADIVGAPPRPAVRRAPTLAFLLESRDPAYTLTPSAAREVGDLLAPHSISLILADPPRPDGVFLALCGLWSSWLWDSPQAHAMRPFLRRRRFDWEWHWGALQSALVAVAPLLTPDGRLVTLFNEPDEGLMESVCLAASAAGYDLLGWGASPGVGCRLVWRFPRSRRKKRREPVAEELEAGLARAATGLARSCLQGRGEPTPWMLLHAAVYAGLAGEGGQLDAVARLHPKTPSLTFVAQAVRRGLEALGLVQVSEESDLYWLPALDDGPSSEPLADRVEETVRQALQSRGESTDALIATVYAALDGPLTPDFSLVLLCLDSYSAARGAVLELREEDDPDRRAEELAALKDDLRALGERLGFRVKRGRGWDVRWQEEGQDLFLFVLSATAALGCFLLRGLPAPEGAVPCLVFPGGRAELLANKLRRDPRMARVAEESGWQLIKFRHLRHLIAEGLDRQLFETVLGLDPIVEGEDVQIPLVLGGER